MLSALADIITRVNLALARALSGLLLLLVITQFTSVVLRYVFSIGFLPLHDSILYLHATMFLLVAAGAWATDAQVRVDVWYRDASPLMQARINALGAVFLALPFCLFVFSSAWDYVTIAWTVREGAREISGLPFVYLLKTVILLFAVSLGAQSVAQAIRAGLLWREHKK